jgi:hypothetical protein
VDGSEFVSAPSNREDNEDVGKSGEGQGASGDCGSNMERIVVDESSESDVREESGPGIGRIDSETGKVKLQIIR